MQTGGDFAKLLSLGARGGLAELGARLLYAGGVARSGLAARADRGRVCRLLAAARVDANRPGPNRRALSAFRTGRRRASPLHGAGLRLAAARRGRSGGGRFRGRAAAGWG